MVGGLILALSLAGFLLLMFGERLGMPSQTGNGIVLLIFTLMTISLSLASVTSRLAVFISADGRAARVALPVSAGICLAMLDPTLDGPHGSVLMMFCTFWLVLLIVPEPNASNSGSVLRVTGGHETRNDTELRWVLAGCTGLSASVLLLRLWPEANMIWHQFVGQDLVLSLKWALIALFAPLILGGLHALSRLARTFLMLALVLVLLPAILVGLSEVLALIREGAEATLAASRQFLSQHTSIALHIERPWGQSMPVLIGMAAGLIVRTAWVPTLSRPLMRLGHAVIAMLVFMVIMLSAAMMLPPLSLPFAGQIRHLPAGLVQTQGWPLIIGLIWAALAIGAMMTMIALVLHVLATTISESLAYRLLRPKGLKAWRLVMARIATLLLVAVLFWQVETGWQLDTAFTQFVLSGCAFLLILTLFIRMMRHLCAFWHMRRVRSSADLVLADA